MSFAPPTVVPNYDDPPSNGTVVLLVPVVITAIQVVVVGLRMYTRKYISGNLGWDDYLITLATVVSLAILSINGYEFKYGLGRHIWDIPPQNLEPLFKSVLAIQIVYPFVLGLIKLSILSFYLRVFDGIWIFRHALIYTIVFITSMTIAYVFAMAFQCVPVRQIYTLAPIPGSKCVNSKALFYSNSILNIITDIWILLLPVVIIYHMYLSKLQKALTIGLFSLGVFTCVASILRFYYLIDLYRGTNLLDSSWNSSEVSIFSALEGGVGAITASIPAIKPLINHYYPGFLVPSGDRSRESDGQRQKRKSTQDGYDNINELPLDRLERVHEDKASSMWGHDDGRNSAGVDSLPVRPTTVWDPDKRRSSHFTDMDG